MYKTKRRVINEAIVFVISGRIINNENMLKIIRNIAIAKANAF